MFYVCKGYRRVQVDKCSSRVEALKKARKYAVKNHCMTRVIRKEVK